MFNVYNLCSTILMMFNDLLTKDVMLNEWGLRNWLFISPRHWEYHGCPATRVSGRSGCATVAIRLSLWMTVGLDLRWDHYGAGFVSGMNDERMVEILRSLGFRFHCWLGKGLEWWHSQVISNRYMSSPSRAVRHGSYRSSLEGDAEPAEPPPSIMFGTCQLWALS